MRNLIQYPIRHHRDYLKTEEDVQHFVALVENWFNADPATAKRVLAIELRKLLSLCRHRQREMKALTRNGFMGK